MNKELKTITLTQFQCVKQGVDKPYYLIFDKNENEEENQGVLICFKSNMSVGDFNKLPELWRYQGELTLSFRTDEKGRKSIVELDCSDFVEEVLIFETDLKKPLEYLSPNHCSGITKIVNRPHICVKCYAPEKGYSMEWFNKNCQI